MEYLNELNEDQKEAVLYNEGPMAVLSGAGSGKTKTLVTKVQHLLQNGVDPKRIVTVTLTNKAAEEMKDRLRLVLDSDTIDELQVSTIHSYAYKILKKLKTARDPYTKIPQILANEFEPFLVLLNKAKENNLGNKQVFDHLGEISWHKTRMISVEQYREQIQLDEKLKEYKGDLSRLNFEESAYYTWVEYNAYLKKKGKMDFTDILLKCLEELENPSSAEKVAKLAQKIEYLIVDEAQDTTLLAFKVLDKLASVNNKLILIGDVRQSIYSFAGAEVQNIIGFIREKKPKIVDLKVNYRSTKRIVDNANTFIRGSKSAIGVESCTYNEEGPKIIQHVAIDECDEAEWVLLKIEQLLSQG